MEIIFSFILAAYVMFLAYVWYIWRTIPSIDQEISTPYHQSVSIVIAVRNEQANVEKLVSSLSQLNYPPSQFEVIIVNDQSEDKTEQLLRIYTAENPVFKIVNLPDVLEFNGSYKKRALTEGISKAKYETIITTDADCLFDPNWVSSLIQVMQQQNWKMGTGPVIYQSKGWSSSLLNIELASLVAIGAVSLFSNHPNMCNGANLVFSKHAFNDVDGYQGFEQVISGDDEFLLYKIFNKYPNQVGFIKQSQAIVTTAPPKSWTQFLNQRKRWSGKWKKHKSITTRLLAISIFCFHLSFLSILWLFAFGNYSGEALVAQIMVKLLAEYLLVNTVLNFMSQRTAFIWYLAMQILYSFYVVLVALVVQFSGFTWKNRRYR